MEMVAEDDPLARKEPNNSEIQMRELEAWRQSFKGSFNYGI